MGVVADIEALGGEVTFQYKYAGGLAAKIPADSVFKLAENLNVKAMFLDEKRSISGRGQYLDGDRAYKEPILCLPLMNSTNQETCWKS